MTSFAARVSEVKPDANDLGLSRHKQSTKEAQKSFSESSKIVTGPSFVNSRDIIVWNMPVCTGTPRWRNAGNISSS